MIAHLKPYSAYKYSGVAWLGQIPAHWDVKRNKLFLQEVNNPSKDGSEELLTVSQHTGVTRRRERLTEDGEFLTSASSLVGYKCVKPGDLVMNIMLAWNGSLGVSAVEGIVSPAYCIFRTSPVAEPRFFHYLFRTSLFAGAFRTVSTGVVDSRLRLYPDVLFRLPSLVPPAHEQSAIVRYLDHVDRGIRRYIRAKQELIKLLEEQRQAFICRAVTRGLDPNVRLKPSGVEWLGGVPEHWDLLRARYLFREIDRRSPSGEETHLSMSQELGLVPSSMVEQRTLVSESYAGGKLCDKDDLVLNRLKAHLGVFAVAKQGGVISPDYTVLRPTRPMVIQYFEHILRSAACRHELCGRAKGIVEGFWRLYTDDLYDIRLPVPDVTEQRKIVESVASETALIKRTIGRTEREIELVREYRTRLIADVVTGKLDVRETAAKLVEV